MSDAVPDIVLLSERIDPTTLVRALRRELLRWRDLVAALYEDASAGSGLDAEAHRAAFRALLQLRPVAARQIPLRLG